MKDESIVNLFWERSEKAIEETDKKYGKLCVRLSTNILKNESDAEECVEDSYLALWNSIPDARPKNLSAYLCRIVKNLSFKKLEYLTAIKRKPEYLLSLDELRDCVSGTDSTENNFDVSGLSEAINMFLRGLNNKERNIFLRRYWYYDSVKSIALDYNVKENNISAVLFKLRKKLKSFLEKEGYIL